MAQDYSYFAAQEPKKLVEHLYKKTTAWSNLLKQNQLMEKWRCAWSAYHGAYYDDFGYSHQVTFSGEQGELTNFPVNHFRNLAQHMLVMTTTNRPSMEARAVNTDYKSLVQTQLANGLLEYFMREKKLETYLKTAVEYAIVFGAGYVKMEWNATTGEIYDVNEELNTPIYEGDVEFTNLSPFDVMYDSTKENQNHDWIIIRSFKNKFDLMAKYPEQADKIKGLQSKSDLYKFRMNISGVLDETVDIPVYEFYHRRSEALSQGRYTLFLDNDVVLYDGAMPYRVLPVFRIAPGDILGTPYGYTPMFDILPIQEGINSLYSTILTNQSAFGVQNIIVPRGTDINITELVGGLNAIEVPPGAGEIKSLNLTHTPPEVFKFLEMLEKVAETLTGVNSVARGNPEASLKSGTALALIQSMALQFMSGLQQSYVELIEGTGTALIKMLQDFAEVPRIAAIVGKNNRPYLKEFKGSDIGDISRVIVDVGNPLAKTTAGRIEIAKDMLQMGLIKNPQDYFSVLNTGQLNVMTEDSQRELNLIKSENEKMIEGEVPIVTAIDEHALHITEHRCVIADPDLRKDAGLVKRVLDHITQHIDSLRNTDPQLLQLIGQQSLQQPPQQGQPAQQGEAPQGGGGPAGNPAEAPAPLQGAPTDSVQGPGMESPVPLPNLPKPPSPFQGAPVTAQQTAPK